MKRKEPVETINLRDKIRKIDELNMDTIFLGKETSKINHCPLHRNEMRTFKSTGYKPEDKSNGQTSRDKWRAFRWI